MYYVIVNKMENKKNYIIIGLVIALVLTVSYFMIIQPAINTAYQNGFIDGFDTLRMGMINQLNTQNYATLTDNSNQTVALVIYQNDKT